MKHTRSNLTKRPFILAVSAAALLAGILPTQASLLLDPSGGTVLFDDSSSHDDQTSNGRALGFVGNYFGTPRATVDVSTNGNLNFTGDTEYSNFAMPGSVTRISAIWDDLYITSGNGASITEKVLPGVYYAATWNSVDDYATETVKYTFQITWFGGPHEVRGFTFKADDIVFSYESPFANFTSGPATVGLDSGDGTNFVPLPGTTDGLVDNSMLNLLQAAQGGFVLFRANGSSYTPYIAAPVLQNSAPVGTPVDANFIVIENAVTGTQAEGNAIGSILFAEQASLRVYNTLTVARDYIQSGTGTLKLSLSSTTTFDRVAVGGVASLDGTLDITLANGFKPKRGETFAVLTAAGGISGEFDEVTSPFNTPLLGLGAIYQPNAVLVTVQQQSFEQAIKVLGGTPNQIATARGLDSVAFGTTVPAIIDFLDEQPIGDLPGNLDKVAPEELASIFNISCALANVQMTNLERRMEDIRNGSSGFSGQRFALQGKLPGQADTMGFAGVKGSSGKECKDCKVTAPAEENRWGFFINGAGEFVDIENTGNARGYDFQSGGVTLGVDYRVSDHFAVGLTAGYAHTGVDLTGQGELGVDAGRLGLYATGFVGGFYVDAAVSGGYGAYDTRRGAISGSAYGDTTSGELDTYVGLGYDFKVGALTFGPIANFQYTYVDLDGFTEHGSLAPLKYDQQSNESIRTTLGLKAAYDFKCGGLLVRPSVRVAWQHEFGDSAPAVAAALASGSSQFTVFGPSIGEDSLLVGAGFSVQFNERTSAFVYYDGEFGRTNYQLNAVSGGVRLEF